MFDLVQSSLLFLLIFLVQGVAAMGAMDVIALILGLAMLIFGICALIGFYARKQIQEVLDERQNNLDSLLAHNQVNTSLGEPFAFESEIDTNTYPVDLPPRSMDESSQPINEPDTNLSNEINSHTQTNSSWLSRKNPIKIKKESITPPKAKRRQSNGKRNTTSAETSLRQMTLTQLFDPAPSPRNSSPVKREPETPDNDTTTFMPESLIGLAQLSDDEDQPLPSHRSLLKRKATSSPSPTRDISEPVTTDEEENVQNNAILQSSYSGIESEELLYACPMCRNYWLGLPEELRHKQGLTCRHRQRPVARTPEHFWSLGIPSTQTCIERGYGGVLPPDKPIERPRRPRRQHQRQLQEQQQNHRREQDSEEV
ncbi:unnamed protein product [Adineta ricciae]|uniref:Uncharacterized protein n=1 Tax=Adineta ricciae TaxID=249248 RepID=A0A816B319_ADIRI|nr:unnamed protein product [Adineta ricciae]